MSRRDRTDNEEDAAGFANRKALVDIRQVSPHLPLELIEQYEELKVNLLTRFRDVPLKTIVFAGIDRGVGNTTTVSNLAFTLAHGSTLRVLLIDAHEEETCSCRIFNLNGVSTSHDAPNGNGQRMSLVKLGAGNLYFLRCIGFHASPTTLLSSRYIDRFFQTVGNKFDCILIDAPPVTNSLEFRLMCAKVDGVVLVLESSKTRVPEVRLAKHQIETAGGKVLGTVLNKRKSYVPNFISRIL